MGSMVPQRTAKPFGQVYRLKLVNRGGSLYLFDLPDEVLESKPPSHNFLLNQFGKAACRQL
jgi:hypothetical protein